MASDDGSKDHECNQNGGSELVPVDRTQTPANKSAIQKQLVVESLALGRSMKETAQIVGVGRSTIYEWLKCDPTFRAAYNQWQNTVQQNVRSRMLALMDTAVDAVGKALAAGDARLGMEFLTKSKAFEAAPVERPTSAAETKAEMDLEDERRRVHHHVQQTNLEADLASAECARDAWAGEPKTRTVQKALPGNSKVKKTVTKALPDPMAQKIWNEVFGKDGSGGKGK